MKPFGTRIEDRMYAIRNKGYTISAMERAFRSEARVICYPSSGGGSCDPYRLREQLSGFDLDWIETRGPGDALAAAEEWDDGLPVVAGGTINEVVNGLGRSGVPEAVTLALLPAGTGNDLAATPAIPEDAGEAEAVVRQNRVHALDVARAHSESAGERFFLSVATGGLGTEISAANDRKLKGRWGKLSYLRPSLAVVRSFDAREVKLILNDEEKTLRAVNVAVGNGRYAGGGWLVAPRANPEDGLLDVVMEEPGIEEVLSLAPAALFSSDYLDKRGVFFACACEVRVEAVPPGLEFTVDGEVIGDGPAEFAVVPRALRL